MDDVTIDLDRPPRAARRTTAAKGTAGAPAAAATAGATAPTGGGVGAAAAARTTATRWAGAGTAAPTWAADAARTAAPTAAARTADADAPTGGGVGVAAAAGAAVARWTAAGAAAAPWAADAGTAAAPWTADAGTAAAPWTADAAGGVEASVAAGSDPAAGAAGVQGGRLRGRGRPLQRATPTARVAVLLALAFAATAPQGAPVLVSQARAVPLPSFCTGVPIPGGRLNIVRDGTYIILDAPTNTVVGEGACPRHNGSR